MGVQVDFNNPASYKNCSKKQYEIYVCMPPKNTIVINKLEQADVVKQLGGRTYFTVDDIKRLQAQNPAMITTLQQLVGQGRAYAVTDATPFVLCGTVGEMWTIKPDKLASTYMFLQNGQPLQINQQTLNQRMKNGVLDWTVIRTSPQATAGQNMACFVPTAQKGQIQTAWGSVLNLNGVGVSHGKGDFVVCEKLPNGQPNLGNRWVVNGEIFATTYNNQGWAQCLNLSSKKNFTIDKLPKLLIQCSKSSIDFEQILNDTKMSDVQGAVNIGHILESVYDRIDTDTVKARAGICLNIYNSTGTGYGSASLFYANSNSSAMKGVLNNSINAVDLFKNAVECCQSEDKKFEALSVLYNIAYIVASNATVRLFFDTHNKYINKLWKNVDTEYMVKSNISLYFYDQSRCSINQERVCIDFNLSSTSETFVRFVFTRTGSFTFKFLPKDDIANASVGATYRFDSFNNFLSMYKKLSDVFYNDLLDIPNLDKYLFTTSKNTIFKLVSTATEHLFKLISDTTVAEGMKSVKKDGQYRFTFNVGDIERVVYLQDTDTGISVKSKLNSVEFNKTYKVSIKHGCTIIAMAIFSDICKLFKLHPAKSVYKSRSFWKEVVKDTNDILSKNPYSYDTSKISKIDIVGFNSSDDTKYQLKVRFFDSMGNVTGERILIVDFNYRNFDLNNARSRSYKALADLESKTTIAKITDLFVALYYKSNSKDGYDVYNSKLASVDYNDTAATLYSVTGRLTEMYKKYKN